MCNGARREGFRLRGVSPRCRGNGGRIGQWGHPPKLGMRPIGVIIGAPLNQHDPGVGDRAEQRLVKQFIPQAAVEALDKAILHRLAGCDVMPLDRVTFSPAEDRVAGQLRFIVADDGGGLSAPGHAYRLADRVIIPNVRFRRDIGSRLIAEGFARIEHLNLLDEPYEEA